MINLIKARTPILAILLSLLAMGYTFAANRVVVVPLLGSDSAQWALVDTNHDIIAQSGGISVALIGGNSVWMDFGKSVVGRPIIVTPQYHGPRGFIRTVICGADPSEIDATCGDNYSDGNHVFVYTTDTDNASAARAFYIVIP